MDTSGQTTVQPLGDSSVNADSAAVTAQDSGVTYSGAVGNTSVAQLFGFFNVLVGLMLVAGFLFFFGGFVAYLTRLGLDGRTQGLRYMYYGLSVLFVLMILLAIVHYLQFNPGVVFAFIAVVVIIFGGMAALRAVQEAGHAEDDH